MRILRHFVPVACVAVTIFLSTGCSGSNDAPVTTSAPAPAATSITPAPNAHPTLGVPMPGYDEWTMWNSGESSPELLTVMRQLGLTTAAFPKADFATMGYVGVAQVSTGCLISFEQSNPRDATRLSASIFSRFTSSGLTVGYPDGTIPQLVGFVQRYRKVCTV